jgi:TolB-like protein/Tfp pilus assembly protein PilF
MPETRKIAAILAADIVGFSRLASVDEERTLARLRTLRSDLVDPAIAVHNGRVVKRTGDGILVEFRSVVDAVRCAIEMQAGMVERNAGVPHERLIQFRVGIHLGDVVEESDGDLMGTGVNIAARLEGIATPGAICISEDAYRQVKGHIDLAVSDLGAIQLKNIVEPVRAYALAVGPSHEVERPRLALPDKPSIAVLPFQNISGDPEQGYFADGVVEDIITALSCLKSLFVIARNSSFTYKGDAIDTKQVGHDLGVRYVLRGSVRKAGTRVRITGQLLEASSGLHIWADKFDGALEDVFELQDAVTERVVSAIEPSVRQAEINRAHSEPTNNLDAYDHYLRALPPHYQYTCESSTAAVAHLRRAIELDPGYTLAKSFLAFSYAIRWLQGWSEASDRANGIALAQEAIDADPSDPSALRWAGHTLGFWGDHDRALAILERAASLNVNGSQVLSSLGWVKCYACTELDRAIEHFERAIRLSPRDPEMAQMLSGIALAHLIAGHDEEALIFARRSIDEMPRFTSGHRTKVVALGCLGRREEAKAAADTLLIYDPAVRW